MGRIRRMCEVARRGIAVVDSPRSDLEGGSGWKEESNEQRHDDDYDNRVDRNSVWFGDRGLGRVERVFCPSGAPGAGRGYGGARGGGGPFRLVGPKLGRAGGPRQSLGARSLQRD